MNAEYMSATPTLSDHDLTLAIPGDVESVRSRLREAIQDLGYKLLGEQPLHAKRGGQGSARWDCSLNVLDYPTTLTISLRQMNEVAVVATFNYEIKSCMRMTRGDRQTLAREAEAIGALATERLAISACPACGVQVTDDSHFCRRCGAPLVLALAELEVLRLTRGTRSSYHSIFVGMFTLIVALLCLLPVFFVAGPKIHKPLLWIAALLSGYGFFVLFQGIWQLHHTLNPKKLKDAIMRAQPVFAASRTVALPPAPAQASVTEGTTELLFSASDRRTEEPIRRKGANTADIDEERLM